MPTGGKLGLLYFHCSSLSLPSANPLISHFWQNGKSVSSANFLADSWPRSIVSQLTSLGRPPSASSALLLGTDPGGRDRSHNAGARCRGGSYSAIRKASLFARERKRDSEEEVLLKMADLGGGRHPVSAVRSKQLTRRAFWADPTIHYLGQVAVESREGIEELTIDQARILGRPDRRRPRGKC